MKKVDEGLFHLSTQGYLCVEPCTRYRRWRVPEEKILKLAKARASYIFKFDHGEPIDRWVRERRVYRIMTQLDQSCGLSQKQWREDSRFRFEVVTRSIKGLLGVFQKYHPSLNGGVS